MKRSSYFYYLQTETDAPTDTPHITLPRHITTISSSDVRENHIIDRMVSTINERFLPIVFIRQPKQKKWVSK
jgi:hypothetical protein